MAHEFESGFFVAQAAWHRLGTVLQQPPTTEKAITEAGLDWQVLEEPLYQAATEHPDAVLCKRLVRDFDKQILGTVKYDYTPLQNNDAFRWFDPLLTSGKVALETAGSLQGGKRIWIMAKVTETEADIRFGDWVRPYLLLHNSHDGSTAVWIQFTPVRVVCMNTLAGAAARRFGELWKKKAICIPHTATLQAQMAKIQDLLDLTRREFQFSVDEYKAMASHEINHELLATYMGHVLRTTSPQLHPAWSQLILNFERGLGNQGSTLWDAYNAVTEWIDHQRGMSAEERLESTWFGAGAQLRTKAHQAALAMMRTHSTESAALNHHPYPKSPALSIATSRRS